MTKKRAFSFNLDEKNQEIIQNLIGQFEEIEFIKLSKLEDIIVYAGNSEADYLVLDANTPCKKIEEYRGALSGFALNTKLLWMTNENLPKEFFDISKISDIFKSIQTISADISLLRKISTIYDFVNINNTEAPLKDESYVPLDMIYLNAITKSPCDVFLKISEKKFIKIINKDDDFKVNEIIQNYANKNITEFFINFKNLTKFRESMLKNIFKFDDKKETTTSHQIKVTEAVISIAKDFGLSDFVIEGINETFADIHRDFNTNSKLKNLFDQIGKLEGSVLGNHSYLTAIFVAMIGNKIPWFTREVKKNLFTVSILHDLDLVDTGLEKYEFKTIHEINSLSNQEKEIIKNHTNSLSKKLSKIDVIPSDVVNIISKHHEGAGPNSYPQGLNSPQLSPPICLFIIAHQFAIELTNIAFNADKVAQAFGVVKEQYSSNSYKPFLDILEKELSQ